MSKVDEIDKIIVKVKSRLNEIDELREYARSKNVLISEFSIVNTEYNDYNLILEALYEKRRNFDV